MFWLNAFKSLTAAAVLATAGWAGAASATTVSATDTNVTWSSTLTCLISSDCAGVSAALTFDVSGYNNGTWLVDLTIQNTSSATVTGTSYSTGFLNSVGFNTDPNATMSDFTQISAPSGTTWNGGSGSVPSTNTELCVWNGQNCEASNGQTMTYGTTSKVSFLLTSLGATSLSFDGYAVKFGGVGKNGISYEFGSDGLSTVPLPATGLLLLGALGGLGLVKRRRRKAA